MQRAAIYTRISKDKHGTAEGVQRQEKLCRERADREGWLVARTFCDNDVSASKVSRKKRPEYDAMLAAARAGEVEVVLAYSNSRLTRRMRELEDLIDLHEETGVEIRTLVSGDDDLSTASGRTVARIKASVDSGEAEATRERLLAQQADRRAKGIQRTRRAFGWGKYVPGTDPESRVYIDGDKVNAEEATAIRKATADVLMGKSTSEIAREWNSQGTPSVTGVPWQQRRVVEVLTRWRNAGVPVHKGEPLDVQGQWESIVSREDLERVRLILLDPARRSTQPGRPPSTLLSSTALCGVCGMKMTGSKTKNRDGSERFNYRCSSAMSTTGNKHYLGIKRDVLDNLVLDALRREVALGGVEGLIPSPEVREHLHGLRERIAAIGEEEREVGRMMGDGVLSVAAMREALTGLAERRAAVQSEIDTIERGFMFSDLVSAILPHHKVSLTAAAEVGKKIKALTKMQQRELVKAVLVVKVHPGRGDDRVEIKRRGDAVGA